ncbi:13550_t:CDS:2 [Racocetra fulgida]|uniref:13550_t:CDS:1 n=1 Tax=Racocetra fulgida TaxID=60492 RepID=A0A9N9G217_9GLOM|nr:13550_t:CDS:2 [Racocetra fulgida]
MFENWIESKISEGEVTEYKFEEFENFKCIGSGAFNYDPATLPLSIKNGLRENPIAGTNPKFCWQGKPDNRPSIQEVAMELKNLAQDAGLNNNFDVYET